MAIAPITPTVPTTGGANPPGGGASPRRRPTITQMTPPIVKGKSWLGVDPTQTMTTATAKEGLQGYLGGDITPHMGRISQVLRDNGYTDATFAQDLTGAQYNALLKAGAEATGNTFTPYSTTAGDDNELDGLPYQQEDDLWAGTTDPVPTINLPEYQRRGDFAFNGADLENDPGYRFRLAEAQKALERRGAATGNLRGGNFMRDLLDVSQGVAADEFSAAYGRAADTYDRNVGGDRYAYEADTNRRQVEYAPRLLEWQRNRDEAFRRGELGFDREWQREVYGRDDAWRRHQYANDDAWRRFQLEEERRWRLAGGGLE